MKTNRLIFDATVAIALAISCPLVTRAQGESVDEAPSAQARTEEIKASDSQDVSLTIYNQNFGLVRDVRTVDLKAGVNYLRFEDVAAQIDPTTVNFTSLTAPNAVTVREQNYQYDVLDPITILSKSVGKSVKFREYLASGQVHETAGILLNPPQSTVFNDASGNSTTRMQGLVLKTSSGVVLNPSGEAELAELPLGLVPKPSLLWKLETTKGGKHRSEIDYQTAGLNWHCDYVVVVNADETQADITSWVTLDNKSGATFKNAALKLMAGDVHKLATPPVPRSAGFMSARAQAAPEPQFSESGFAEYHLYTLAGRTSVNSNETKQMSLFNASKIGTQKKYVFDPENGNNFYPMYRSNNSTQKVAVKVEIANSKANGLGMPMPKGKVRVYKKDQDGALEFIGEDNIDHTPKDEKVRVYLGDAFDIIAERKQTNQQQVSDRVQRLSYEISIRNHKDSAVSVTDVEHAFGQWKIVSSSHESTKRDAHTFEFAVDVPANGESKVTYTVETKY